MSDTLFPITSPTRDFAHTQKLLYGFPKTGKTTLMSYFRDKQGRPPLFIMSEKGEGELAIQRVLVTSWEGFTDQLIPYLELNRARLQAEHSSFVIDVTGDFDDMCTNFVCKKNHVESLADMGHGKGFHIEGQAFKNAIMRLMVILPVNFIAHSDEKEITWNGEKIKIQAPTLGKRCMNFVNGKVDTIMWIAPSSSKKEYPDIVVQNSLTAIAGSRHKQLIGKFTFDPNNIPAVVAAINHKFESAPLPAAAQTAEPSVMDAVAGDDKPDTPTP